MLCFHADNRDMWYFYLGAPQGIQSRTFPAPGVAGGISNYPGPAGIKALGALTLQTYFMIGKGIPDLPPPHPRIEAILARAEGADRIDESLSALPVPSNPTTMEAGDGFAHGLNFELNADFNFLLFYASMDMVLGYNINLRQYSGRTCRIISGPEGAVTSEERPLGINGWYAKGDAYAGIEGELGLGVNFDFFEAKIPIIKMGCAIRLEAEFPSPEHFKGRAGLYYDILNGAVTGRCNFVFEVGNKCYDPNYSPLDGLKFITDLKPEGSQVSVYTKCEAAFAFAMDRILPLKDEQYEGEEDLIRYFRPEFKRFLITKASDGSVVEFRTPTLRNNGFQEESRAVSALTANTTYNIRAEVIVYERINGSWVQVRKRDGSLFVDFMEKSFTTGPHPTTLIPENILMTYPIQKQRNFLIGEKGEKGTNTKGWVMLDVEDPILLEPAGVRTGRFTAMSSITVSYKIHIEAAESNSPPLIVDAIRNDAKTITWQMPNALALNTRYVLKVVKQLETTDINFDALNLVTFQTIRLSYQVADIEASTATIKETKLNNTSSSHINNVVMLKYFFKTSQFPTLRDKMAANTFTSAHRGLVPEIKFTSNEPFDEFDKNGYTSAATGTVVIPPLVFLKEDYNNAILFNNMKYKVYTYGKDLKATRWNHTFIPATYGPSLFPLFMNDIRATSLPYWAFPERNSVDVIYNNIGAWANEVLPQQIGLGIVSPPLSGSELFSAEDLANTSEPATGSFYNAAIPAASSFSGIPGFTGTIVGASTYTAPYISVLTANEWLWNTHARNVQVVSQSIISRMNRILAISRINEYTTVARIGDWFSVRSGPSYMNFTAVSNASISPAHYTYLAGQNYTIDWYYHRPGDKAVKRTSSNWRL